MEGSTVYLDEFHLTTTYASVLMLPQATWHWTWTMAWREPPREARKVCQSTKKDPGLQWKDPRETPVLPSPRVELSYLVSVGFDDFTS